MSEIPNSIRSRIQKLLALASDARGNEHESQSAATKVQALLAEYNLEISQIGGQEGGKVAPDAERTKSHSVLETLADWQVKLFGSIAENNFCFRVLETHDSEGHAYAERVYSLIGRKVNIATTIQVYDYLTSTVDRLCPFPGMRSKASRSWKSGCADRLCDRLYTQRSESEAASRVERNERPRGNGSDLVLSEVYSSESDLNRDYRWGYEPGTSARERLESEARRAAEREARRNAPPTPAEPPRNETQAQRRNREAKEKAESERYWKRYDRRRAKEAEKIDQAAYSLGQSAGANISLDRQIEQAKAHRAIG